MKNVKRPRKQPAAPRRVWRITPEAPLGEFVDVDEVSPAQTPDQPRNAADSSWRVSSHDLLNGLEVEDFTDTLSNDDFDQLFKR